MHRPLLVTCRLASALAGDPPRLDALLEYVLSLHHPKAVPGYKVERQFPCPPQGAIPIPLHHTRVGEWLIPHCSDPILGVPRHETVEHVAKRIGVERAELLAPESQGVVAMTNSWTKNYRLPLRIRLVDDVRWFACGDRRETLKVLRRVDHVGKKVADGYGRVAGWDVEAVAEDRSWFAATPHGTLLMRTLPAGDWLPPGLIGARAGFGGVVPPYWHPDRYSEIMCPC